MAKIHILAGSGGAFQAVIHAPTPAGNNDAGVSWKTAIANSASRASVMPVGNGSGQISTAEANQVAGADLIEAVVQFQDNPDHDPQWDATKRAAYLLLVGNQAIAALTDQYKAELRLFGATAN